MRDYELTLNLVTNDKPEEKIFKQYDTGNEIKLEVLENENLREDKKLVLSNQTVLAFFKRADGQVLQKNCTIKNGNIIVKTSKDVLGVPGKLELECLIKEGDVETTTTRMSFDVKESIARDKSITEDERYKSDLVTELLDVKDNVRKDTIGRVEKSGVLIEWDSKVTDYSTVLINTLTNAEGENFIFEPGKVYPFTNQIDINGMKNCTIDFRNAILKDMGHMMDVSLITQDDTTGEYKATPAGQELNPLGIRFTNFQNLTITNLILDSADMPVSPNNYRISHADVEKKRANICFATGRNLEFINSEFRCGQGTYIQGAYVQNDETRMVKQLEFFMSKICNVDSVKFINNIYNGKSKTEVFGFGKCKHVLFEGIDKQSDTLVSFFKMLQCEDVKIKGFEYSTDKNFSLCDISGTNYVIENVNLDYKNGKAFDITNEWGLSGGALGDFTIKNSTVDADTVLFCSMPAYEKLYNLPITTINSVTVDGCRLGHDDERATNKDSENVALSSNTANILNLNVYNTTITNIHFSSHNIQREEQYKNHTTTVDKLHYIVRYNFWTGSTGGGAMPMFNVCGKSIVSNSIFDMNNFALLIKDGMVSGNENVPSAPKNLINTPTFLTFRDCVFNDTELNLAIKCEFINCTFNNTRLKSNRDWAGKTVKFEGCKFYFSNDTTSYSSGGTNISPFYFVNHQSVEFYNCTLQGCIKTSSNNIFLSTSYTADTKFILKNTIFDLYAGSDTSKSKVYLFQLTNKASTDTYSMDILLDSCEMLNYTIPLKLTGNSVSVESTRKLDIVIKNCISKQTVDNYSIVVDSGRTYYELINLTLKNNEMTKYREGTSDDGISIPSNATFKRLVKTGNTGIVV